MPASGATYSPFIPRPSSRSRSSSPPYAEPDRDWVDVLSPAELGLPLHKNSPIMSNTNSNIQVVDPTSSRRRGAPETVTTRQEEEEDSNGKGDKDKEWPTGIGMESRFPPAPVQNDARERREKYDRLIPASKGPRTLMSMVRDTGRELAPYAPLIAYTILSLFTRLYKIGHADSVVWDEAHFGKFGAFYLNRTFFFDVHPPLGKMLVGLAGALAGFNGSFDYPSGAVYPDHVPYQTMRVLLALPGVAMVPLAWGTAVELRFSKWSSHIVTLMVLCDLAWLAISRFILLDSMLLFFTFTTIYCLACFNNQQRRPFEEDWWLWLTLTGVSIGCVASIKWVGLFVTCVVGLYTAEDLWNKLGDINMPYRVYVKHWIARILCLIVIPFCVYALCFKIHFMILNRSGTGDSQMSSLFQAHLEGNDFARNPLEPTYGSKLTFKNMGYGGGLLHSHVQVYPVGSQQQQVTCYHYKDNNNEWLIVPTWEDEPLDPEGELRYLKDGDVMRIVHESTGRNLHSHSVAAPVTKLNHEVSAYGNATVGDSNDYWVIEVVDDFLRGSKTSFERIHSLSTRLRLRHMNSNCYLRAANAILPQWGFKQVEVSCDKENRPKDEFTYWNIESHWNDRLPAGDQKLYRSPFLRDFWHLNVAMLTSNNALVPDTDKEDSIASKPFDWPFLFNGMRMNGWHDTGIKFYLVGNAMVWWSSSAALIVWIGTLLWSLARQKRKYNDFAPGEWNQFLYVSKIGFGGWVLHYVPFLIMGRVTYLHHYLPTLYFSVILTGLLLDHYLFKSARLTTRSKALAFALIAGAVVGTFWWFKDAAWGIEGPASELKGRRWRGSWNIVD